MTNGRKTHLVLRLPLNFLRLALSFVRAHLIDKRMGTYEALCSAASHREALCIECWREQRCLHNDKEGVNINTLLSEFKDGAEQIELDGL